MKRHIPTVDDLIELSELSDAHISPDGTRVAYVVRTTDWECNTFRSQIWLATEGSERRQLTFEPPSSYAPRWSPDGRQLSFVTQDESTGNPVLALLSMPETEATHTFTLPAHGYGFEWSPDGRFIAIIAPAPQSNADRQREMRYGDVRIVDAQSAPSKLWLLSIDEGQAHTLSADAPFHVTGFDWHPDNSRIAFTATPTPKADDWDQGGLYVIDLDTEAITQLPGKGISLPHWSPDGKQLAFSRCGTPSYIASNTLGIINVENGETRTLHVFDDDSYLLDWGPEGLYALAVKGTTSHLYLINPESGQTRPITPSDPPGFAITEGWIGLGCTFSKDFSRSAFVSYDIDHCAEVTLLDVKSHHTSPLTEATEEIRDWQLGSVEVFRWRSPDGVPVEGILTLPPGFDPAQRYPLVVAVHGGPTHTSFLPPLSDGDHWYCAIPHLASRGALILQPNYRGSAGYGQDFRTLNVGTLGLSEYLDIVSGVDALIARGWVDKDRVGAIGMSHGGYLAAFLATYTDRFRAAIVLSGISDWALNYYSTDTGGWMRQYLETTPWEDPATYRAASPLTYVSQAQTPVLIQHGARDDRAPITNAYALYRGLKEHDVETRLIVYPEMGHGISKPREFRHLMDEVITWFDRWLFYDPGQSSKGDDPAW